MTRAHVRSAGFLVNPSLAGGVDVRSPSSVGSRDPYPFYKAAWTAKVPSLLPLALEQYHLTSPSCRRPPSYLIESKTNGPIIEAVT